VVITGAPPASVCAGANINMLASSTHSFKVNFCKFTNETRPAIEDASHGSGQKYLAALNGVCAGGGYEGWPWPATRSSWWTTGIPPSVSPRFRSWACCPGQAV
jgi:hypothetical protein